ncbi:MAG: hypothetical protein AAF882_20125 [Pseudomonadota bacterium]
MQEQQVRTGCPDCPAHGPALVAAEIIHHHDIAGPELKDQHFLDLAPEDRAADGAFDHPRRLTSVRSRPSATSIFH